MTYKDYQNVYSMYLEYQRLEYKECIRGSINNKGQPVYAKPNRSKHLRKNKELYKDMCDEFKKENPELFI